MNTKKLAIRLPLTLALVFVAAGATAAPPDRREMPYDTERGIYLVDTDGDTFPDVTEEIEKTDPADERDFPGRQLVGRRFKDSGFPNGSCRAGFMQAGTRLCISDLVMDADSYANAAVTCRDQRAYVCGYEEIRSLYLNTALDATFNISGRWLGDWTGDDQVTCGNRSITSNNDPDIANFEGVCDRGDLRGFWCCHDDD
jgi:hypothetical protein